MTSLRTAGAAVALTLAVLAATIAPASAHVLKTFGTYTVALGWVHEPTYASQINAVQVIVKDGNGTPVNDLQSGDLTVRVSVAGQTSDVLKLDPGFDADTGLGTPGDYEASLIPTAVGAYTFHLTGMIHGTAVDETQVSGDTTFDSVTDPADVEFPVHVPTVGDLATKSARLDGRISDAQATAQTAVDGAGRATLLGIIGIVVAVVLGGTALLLGWRRRT